MSKCQKTTSRGPCTRQAQSGSPYCARHTREEDRVAAYQLTDPKLKESIKHHAKGSLYDLSQQVVLLRSMIEQRLNLAGESDAERISAYNAVSGWLANLTKMTETLNKLAKESGSLMHKSEIDDFVDRVVDIVSEELEGLPNYEQTVDRIISRIEESESE